MITFFERLSEKDQGRIGVALYASDERCQSRSIESGARCLAEEIAGTVHV